MTWATIAKHFAMFFASLALFGLVTLYGFTYVAQKKLGALAAHSCAYTHRQLAGYLRWLVLPSLFVSVVTLRTW